MNLLWVFTVSLIIQNDMTYLCYLWQLRYTHMTFPLCLPHRVWPMVMASCLYVTRGSISAEDKCTGWLLALGWCVWAEAFTKVSISFQNFNKYKCPGCSWTVELECDTAWQHIRTAIIRDCAKDPELFSSPSTVTVNSTVSQRSLGFQGMGWTRG